MDMDMDMDKVAHFVPTVSKVMTPVLITCPVLRILHFWNPGHLRTCMQTSGHVRTCTKTLGHLRTFVGKKKGKNPLPTHVGSCSSVFQKMSNKYVRYETTPT